MKRYLLAVVVIGGLALACESKPTTPTSVSPAAGVDGLNANADGSNLKVTAPGVASPVNDVLVEDAPTLTATASVAKYTNATFQYEFELYNPSGVKVQSGTSSTLSFKTNLVVNDFFDSRFTWRVRAVIPNENGIGPWSAFGSFKTPSGGYIRGAELFDPLTNGRTVGVPVGTTFTSAGIRLETKDSYVEYVLPTTLTGGEFSAILTNIGNGSETWKTKVFSMLQGDGVNTTDNVYRVTVDKRTTWVGQGSPLRFTFCVRPNCYEPNAGPQSWDRTKTYFFKLTWGNGQTRVSVYDGGTNGSLMATAGTSYSGTYAPNPHVIRLGSVGGRAENETNPGTVIRNVWVSAKPRPAFKGDNQ